MSTITDAINMADGARQAGNLDLAVRILIDALRAIEAGRARITPEQTGRVWELWRRGQSVTAIAEATGCSVARVTRITRALRKMYPYDRRET